MTVIGVAAAILAIAGAGAWWWMHRTSGSQNAAQVPANVAQPAPPPVVQPPPPVAAEPPPPVAPVAPVDQALTNDNIVQMVDAKVAPAVILSQIRNSKTAFNLSAPEVIRLSKAGVPATVIEVMRNPKAAPVKSAAPAAATSSPSPSPSPPSPSTTTAAASAPSSPAPVPTPPPAAVSAPGSVVAVTLTDGIPFSIALEEDIPQNAEEGRPLRFTVSKDVRVGDLVVIAKGATVTGAIAQTGRRGTFGIGGAKMTLRLLVTEAVDGKKYRVRAQSARSADGKTDRPVEPLVKPKNKDLVAAAGAEYLAYIDGDVTISVKK